MAVGGLLAHREGDRGFPWLWFVRAVGLVITIITLGLTATGAASFSSIGCDSPAKLNYNVAVTVLSFIFLIYILLATGPTRPLKILPWFIFGQLALDFLLFIFWLAAAATSSISCNDLCNTCNGLYGEVAYGNQDCLCFTESLDVIKSKRTSANPAASPLLEPRRSRGSHSSSSTTSYGGTGDAVISFDAIMTILSAFCLAATILWFTTDAKSRRQHAANPSAANGAGVTSEPIKHEEAGMAPPAAAPGAAPAMYPNQQPPMQQQQQQPTMHQVPYNPTGPQQEQYQAPPPPGSDFSTPPPHEGTAEMGHMNQGQPPMQQGAVHGQTPG